MYSVYFLMNQENFVIASTFNESFGLLRTSTTTRLLTKLSELRFHYREKGQMSLVDLFVWNHIAQATDPRDKVYGLLGLCPRADIDAIDPSYKKSVETVYTDIVCYALQKGSYLPFSMSGLTYNEAGSQIPDWPSWLPTFSKVSESFNTSDYHGRMYKAGFDLLPDWKVTSTGHILKLRGIMVDTISDKSSDFDRLDDARKLVQDPLINFATYNISAVADMQDLFQRHSSQAQFQAADRKEAFWRTITDDFDLWDLSGRAEQITAVEKELASWKYGDRSKLVAGSFYHLNAKSIVHLDERQLYEQGLYEQGLTVNSEAFSVLGTVPLQGRPFAITKNKKLFASVPTGTQVGDIVVIFNGAPAPCILRCAGDEDGCYYIVGEAYVNGIMHGEAMEDGKARWFDLR